MTPAQQNMRAIYINGGPGVFISGLVWLIAALVTHVQSFEMGMIALFIGGALIHPLSVLVCKTMNSEPLEPADPKLTKIALLTLPILFAGFYVAYLASAQRPALFFACMAIAIGLRYLVFKRIYGLTTFALLGSTLVLVGIIAGGVKNLTPVQIAAIVGCIELGFGVWLTRQNSS